jgi:hypothetical protein
MKLSHLHLVSEFHEAFRYRQPEPSIPDLSDKPTNELRPRLIREEIHELREAIATSHRVEQLDALCDIQYVLCGAVLAWGYRSMIRGRTPTVELRKIHDYDAHIAAMLGHCAQMELAAENGFANQVLTHIVASQSLLDRAVWGLGFSPVFDAAFREVHANNMRKLWTKEQMVEWLGENWLSREISFELTNGGYIAWRDDKKIVKPPHHSKVNLSRFI